MSAPLTPPRPSWLPGLLLGSAVCFGGAVVLDRACVARAVPPVIAPMTRLAPPLYDGEPGMCQGPEERPWWWPDAPAPTRLGVLLYDPPSRAERALVETAIDGCAWTSRAVADPFAALALVRLEADAGAPPGLLLAAWCREASMRTEAARGGPIRGDWRDGVADAVGPLQMHGWWPRWCGWSTDRRADLVASAECYLARVIVTLPHVAGCAEPWRVAEALAANAPRYGRMGCAARSKHWETRATWGVR